MHANLYFKKTLTFHYSFSAQMQSEWRIVAILWNKRGTLTSQTFYFVPDFNRVCAVIFFVTAPMCVGLDDPHNGLSFNTDITVDVFTANYKNLLDYVHEWGFFLENSS